MSSRGSLCRSCVALQTETPDLQRKGPTVANHLKDHANARSTLLGPFLAEFETRRKRTIKRPTPRSGHHTSCATLVYGAAAGTDTPAPTSPPGSGPRPATGHGARATAISTSAVRSRSHFRQTTPRPRPPITVLILPKPPSRGIGFPTKSCLRRCGGRVADRR